VCRKERVERYFGERESEKQMGERELSEVWGKEGKRDRRDIWGNIVAKCERDERDMN